METPPQSLGPQETREGRVEGASLTDTAVTKSMTSVFSGLFWSWRRAGVGSCLSLLLFSHPGAGFSASLAGFSPLLGLSP